jgi:hypothetical protein
MMSAILSALATPALAAAEERGQPDNLVVWLFLGLCAMIVIAQIVPLIGHARKHARDAAEQAQARQQKQSH